MATGPGECLEGKGNSESVLPRVDPKWREREAVWDGMVPSMMMERADESEEEMR